MSRVALIPIALIVAACAEATSPRETTGPLFSTSTNAVNVEVCPGDDGAYTSVAAALAAVPAGGTVEICPGTYAEMLVIDKAVTIEGSGQGTVTLAPPVAPPDAVIQVATPDPVIIQKVVIDYQGLDGIASFGRADLTVDRVTVLRAVNPVVVRNDALASGGRARLVVRNSVFDGGSPATSGTGPFVFGDVDALIERNVVRRTTFSCIQVQIALRAGGEAAPNADIIGNDVDECGPAGGIRLRVQAGSVVNVLGNTVRNTTNSNSLFGIIYGFRTGAPTGRIEGNTILHYVKPTAPIGGQVDPAAIAIVAGANPIVRFNDIGGNAQAGLRAAGTATIDARCNWWGAANGPSGNGSGSGDAVVGTVTFVPFATAPVAGNRPPGCRGVD